MNDQEKVAREEERLSRQARMARQREEERVARLAQKEEERVARLVQKQEERRVRELTRQAEKNARERAILDFHAQESMGQQSSPSRPGIHSARKRARESADLSTPSPSKRRSTRHRAGSPEIPPYLAEEQKQLLQSLLDKANNNFRRRKEASQNRTWCDPIPQSRKIQTIQAFLKAMTDKRTLATETCHFCYLKKASAELTTLNWKTDLSEDMKVTLESLLSCQHCFPMTDEESSVPVCWSCSNKLRWDELPKDCGGDSMFIGCEHIYPKELDTLTPFEEKLIALNATYGYITKFTVDKKMLGGGLKYRKHIKGHITVFPNDVESLATTVLPHPLVASLSNIHVLWSGGNQPTPQDVSKLFSVRKDIIVRALQWLKRYNPLYTHIDINMAEIQGWEFVQDTDVPVAVMAQMERQEKTAEEQIRTAPIVPSGDLGREGYDPAATIEDVVGGLVEPSLDNNPEIGLVPDSCEPGSMENVATEEESLRSFELTTTGMFPLDEQSDFNEEGKLQFIADALETEQEFRQSQQGMQEAANVHVDGGSYQPFIRISRGNQFADSQAVDFFPKTFPTLFPFGRGGPKAIPTENGEDSLQHDQTLKYWSQAVLQRHGGRFATHPVFPFLVFNMLVRSSNRRISTVRMSRSTFGKVERLYEGLTRERLEKAKEEMKETGGTTDQGIQLLLRELSIFGYSQPLSNDSRLQMRRNLRALSVLAGLAAIWFTINPNDITNPVKLRIAAHRARDRPAAEKLLNDLYRGLEKTALSINDPVSAAQFFHREISLFFEHFVRTGEESVFGRISHYYGAVETNDRGALHLHGFLWLEGNMQLPSLVKDMANPAEEEYRQKVQAFIDDVFTECLDESYGREIRKTRKVTDYDDELNQLMHNPSHLRKAFKGEANFVAYCCQIHGHTGTCLKYSYKDITKAGGVKRYKGHPCRFKAPWKLVSETGFTADGLLQIKRDHPMVNRYNQSMAIALRHNIDISMIHSRKQGLALTFYMTNYATKLSTPMWQRIALASQVYQQMLPTASTTTETPTTTETSVGKASRLNKTRQFLMRLANRVFSERELSSVEVVSHLLGFKTDYTDVKDWVYLQANTLYWALVRQWQQLQDAISELTGTEVQAETVNFRREGFRLSYVEAYKYRGPVLADLCFYDYLSFVKLEKTEVSGWDSAQVAFEAGAELCEGWSQRLRKPEEIAVVSLQGAISDKFDDDHPLYFQR